jgi:hypothetical protein
MNLSIPNPVPTSGEIRIVRARLAETLGSPLHGIRMPVLAGVGAADLVVDTLGSAYQRVLASFSRPAAPRARA